MEEFELKGQDSFLIIRINEVFGFPDRTSHFGGYDCIVGIDIKVGGYYVKSKFHSSTGELFDFYQKIKSCQTELNGLSEFDSYEGNLEFTVKYTFGKVVVRGKYQETLTSDNILEFKFDSDQSYLKNTVKELNLIVNKYGGMQGIVKK